MSKLTKAQAELLREADVMAGITVADTYRPALALVAKGLATMQELKFGGTMLLPTPAGRAALANGDEG